MRRNAKQQREHPYQYDVALTLSCASVLRKETAQYLTRFYSRVKNRHTPSITCCRGLLHQTKTKWPQCVVWPWWSSHDPIQGTKLDYARFPSRSCCGSGWFERQCSLTDPCSSLLILRAIRHLLRPRLSTIQSSHAMSVCEGHFSPTPVVYDLTEPRGSRSWDKCGIARNHRFCKRRCVSVGFAFWE
jgi:hypothetical protein